MRRCSRRSWRSATSRSTSSARRARSTPMPARSRARGATRTRSPICATPASSATCCWSSSRTAISPSPSFASCSIPPSPTPSGARWHGRATRRSPAIAAKAEKEAAYHLRHAGEWLIRLGDGTAESHRRAQAALDELWPYAGELFESDAVEQALIAEGIAVDPASLRAGMGEDDAGGHRRGDARARPRRNGCRAAAAAAGIPSISAICWRRCSSCSAHIPERPGERRAARARAGGGVRCRRSRDPGADHRRSRRAARGAARRRHGRDRDHADLFRLPGDAGHRVRDRDRAARRRHRQVPDIHRAVAGLDDGLALRRRPAQAPEYGIAPPEGHASRRALFGADTVPCPRCGSTETERISEFGSTACKALYRCMRCAEPFDYFKCH